MKVLLVFLFSISAWGKIKVVTTTTNLRSLVEFVGGDQVEVVSLAKGTQDPHYLEAKPSYVLKVSKADLLVQIGLGLEDAWLPLIIRGARRPDLRPGEKRHLFAHRGVELLEVLKAGEVTRKDGDVHPEGNPHFLLDPVRASFVAGEISKKLAELDPSHQKYYLSNAQKFSERTKDLASKKIKVKKVISYHKTLNYFYNRFGVENIAYLEPKPGVPPSAGHLIKLIGIIKQQKPEKVIVENYFDPSPADRLKKESPKLEIRSVPVAVDADKSVGDILKLYQQLIKEIGE